MRIKQHLALIVFLGFCLPSYGQIVSGAVKFSGATKVIYTSPSTIYAQCNFETGAWCSGSSFGAEGTNLLSVSSSVSHGGSYSGRAWFAIAGQTWTPSAPTTGSAACSGSGGQRYVRVVYAATTGGTGAASAETNAGVISASNCLTVTSPVSQPGVALWDVCVSTTTNAEVCQSNGDSSKLIPIGTNWQEPNTGIGAGTSYPVTDQGLARGSSQDDDKSYNITESTTQGYPSGLTAFNFRGYFRLATPNTGGATTITGRKLVYAWADPSNPTIDWSLILAGQGNGAGYLTVTIQNGGYSGGTSLIYYPTLGANISYDAWYSIEFQIQNDTSSGVTYVDYANGWSAPCNGVMKMWLNGSEVSASGWDYTGSHHITSSQACLNLGHADGIKVWKICQQSERDTFTVVDEFRYWDDIVLSSSYIGP